MHATARARIQWMPASEEERAAVLRQMERLLNSRHFRNSKRYPVLLEYLIRETLAGNSDSLKERVLGIAVFHRPADYDANADPVVRVTAAEIRRRIAQFYQEEGQADEMYIGLRPGSYVPEFHPIKADTIELVAPDSLNAEVKAVPLEVEAIPSRKAFWAWKFTPLTVVVSVIVALTLLSVVWRWQMQDDQRSQMWSPLLNSAAPVLFVVGQPHAGQLEIQSAGSVYDLNATSELYLPDAIAVAHLSNMLEAHHHLYQIAGVTSTSLSDLRKGPSILVGGFNNPGTLRVLSPIRFTMRSVTEGDKLKTPQILQIVDRKNQSGSPWTINLQQPIGAMTHDYAIIARFQASMTDGVVMVVAGLGAGGTESASKFINSSAYMNELAAHAPRDWRDLNMEAVLETEVIWGRTGHTHVIATEIW
jgi:hypothetical protein